MPEANIRSELNYERAKQSDLLLPPDIINELQCANFLIYQPLNNDWGPWAKIHEFGLHVNPNLIAATFPYIYLDGLWPIYPSGDELIGEKELAISFQKNNVIENIFNPSYDYFKVQERLETSFKILEDKEKNCDIKLSMYIKNNLMNSVHFLTQNHPTTLLMRKLLIEVSKFLPLGISEQLIISKLTDEYCHKNTNYCELNAVWPKSYYVGRILKKLYTELEQNDFNANIKDKEDVFYKKLVENSLKITL
jgi:hypothetical protein